MAITRQGARRIAEERAASYNRGVEARNAWNAARTRMGRARRVKMYRPNDQEKKRHRLDDDEEKTERVVSYTRRKG